MSQMEFGLIGNGQVSALIDRDGKMIWSCLPAPDSPSVFAHLLDTERGGFWSIEPVAHGQSHPFQVIQHYLEDTVVLSSRFLIDSQSEFEVLDFAPIYFKKKKLGNPSCLIRILRPLRGRFLVRSRCLPRLEYAGCSVKPILHSKLIEWRSLHQRVFLSSSLSLKGLLHATPFELSSTQFLILSSDPFVDVPSLDQVLSDLKLTLNHWKKWLSSCQLPQLFQREVTRSALTLKLHCFESTGAILAATTTSLPESPEKGRTWDYRFCWWRDAYFVVRALHRLGQREELERFVNFFLRVFESEASGVLQPVYGLRGEKHLLERELLSLSGFKGFGPVRIGNQAYSLPQFDVYGEMFCLLHLVYFDENFQNLDRRSLWRVMQELLKKCREHFNEPDAGIWEFRGKKRHFIFSKLIMCAAAQKGSEAFSSLGRARASKFWNKQAQEMRDQIHRLSWREDLGLFTQSDIDPFPDAALLLMPEFGFLDAGDLKYKRMVLNYEKALAAGVGIYRYKNADDWGVPQTSFWVCSFWFINALWQVGEREKALRWFQQILRYSNSLGLFSEDFDPMTGELWGNFPQCYSHAGLIHSALQISQPAD